MEAGPFAFGSEKEQKEASKANECEARKRRREGEQDSARENRPKSLGRLELQAGTAPAAGCHYNRFAATAAPAHC